MSITEFLKGIISFFNLGQILKHIYLQFLEYPSIINPYLLSAPKTKEKKTKVKFQRNAVMHSSSAKTIENEEASIARKIIKVLT